MALHIVSLLPPVTAMPGPDRFHGLLDTARSAARTATQVEVWPLTAGLFQIEFSSGAADAADTVPTPGEAVVVASFAPSEEESYDALWRTATAMHEALGATATILCDGRRHSDATAVQTPGVAAIAFSHRRPSMDRDAYMHHYLTVHVPIATALKPSLVTGYRTFRTLGSLGSAAVDSVTIQEFESQETLEDFFAARFNDKNDEASIDAAKFIHGVSYLLAKRPLINKAASIAVPA